MKEGSKKITSKTLSVKIADKIRDGIIFGNYKEGERIIEQVLSDEYGVSRIPIREALRLLEAEGFLEISPYKGSVVREITPQQFYETQELRMSIIPTLLKHAIPNYTSKTIKQAEELIDKTEKTHSSKSVLQFILKIHDLMYGPSNLPVIVQISEAALKRHLIILNIYYQAINSPTLTLSPYRTFFELCKNDQTEEALEQWIYSTQKHFEHIGEIFQDWYETNKLCSTEAVMI